jgi:hypothetical protein
VSSFKSDSNTIIRDNNVIGPFRTQRSLAPTARPRQRGPCRACPNSPPRRAGAWRLARSRRAHAAGKPETAGRCSKFTPIIFCPAQKVPEAMDASGYKAFRSLQLRINSIPPWPLPHRLFLGCRPPVFPCFLPEASSPSLSLPPNTRSQHNDSYPWPHMIFFFPSVFVPVVICRFSQRLFFSPLFRSCQILFLFDVFCCSTGVFRMMLLLLSLT